MSFISDLEPTQITKWPLNRTKKNHYEELPILHHSDSSNNIYKNHYAENYGLQSLRRITIKKNHYEKKSPIIRRITRRTLRITISLRIIIRTLRITIGIFRITQKSHYKETSSILTVHPHTYYKKIEIDFQFNLPRYIITIWYLGSTLPSVISTNTSCYHGNNDVIYLLPVNCFTQYIYMQSFSFVTNSASWVLVERSL